MRGLIGILLAAGCAAAAPPVVPVELKADVGKPTLLTVKVEAGKKLGTEKTFDPAALMIARLWTDDPNTYEFWVFPNSAGVYYVPFWTEGETKGSVCKIVAGKGATQPPTPVDPPAPIGDKLHFMIVRPDGPISPTLEAALNLPAWAEVKAKHTYADLPFGQLPANVRDKFKGQPLPFLLTWRYSGGQIVLPDDATAAPVPTTDADVRGLLK